MQTLVISNVSNDFFSVLLPPCDAMVLASVLDPAVPYVELLEFRSERATKWVEENLPPLFESASRVETVQVASLELNVSLSTTDFVRLLPGFSRFGLDLLQAHRRLPPRFSLHSLRPESKGRVFREIGIVLDFHLPHPHEHALISSTSRHVLERIVATLGAT
jgi:hypothetical protein